MDQALVVGAVAYSPNVVAIWEGMRDYFADSAAPMDFVLFSNYARQVEALLGGGIDIAWNTNVAWLRTVARTDGACRALAMRDADAVFRTLIVTRTGGGGADLEWLRGRRLALGSKDSAQAAILPVHWLAQAGLDSAVELVRLDSDLGKHGDTGRSELAGLRAVLDERVDAAAIGVNTWEALAAEPSMAAALEVVWSSPTYSHCNFTALPSLPEERAKAWSEHLFSMDWDDPAHRPILEMEGLRRWVPPRLDGYASLAAAMREQDTPATW